MKIKFLSGLVTVNILTLALLLLIFWVDSTVLRTIIGLPFLLFFPGYALVTALFIGKEKLNGLQKVALSAGMSLAIVGLIGLGLSYTAWGINLEPVSLSIAYFIYLMLFITIIRKVISHQKLNLLVEVNLDIKNLEGNKYLSFILIGLIVIALGGLGYTIATHQPGEKFTEFYLLGLNGQAQDYPSEFTVREGKVTQVRYGRGLSQPVSDWGEVTIGLVNREGQKTDYYIQVQVSNTPVPLNYHGEVLDKLGPIELQTGEKWEQKLGIAPQYPGDNQMIKFLLSKGPENDLVDTLQLSINVKAE